MEGEQMPQEAEVVAPQVSASNSDQHKVLAIVGYIIPILFFVPMLSEKKNEFAMFHANQQLVLLVAGIIVNVVGMVIPFLGWFLILPIGMLALFVFAILGVIHAAKNEMKPLPMIGRFTLIK